MFLECPILSGTSSVDGMSHCARSKQCLIVPGASDVLLCREPAMLLEYPIMSRASSFLLCQ